MSLIVTTGTMTVATDTVKIAIPPDVSTLGFAITGSYTGQVEFEGSIDGVTYVAVSCVNINTNAKAALTTSTGQFIVNVAGLGFFQLRASSLSSGGPISAAFRGSSGVHIVDTIATS